MKLKQLTSGAAALVFFAACNQQGQPDLGGNKQTVGTLAGAAAGAVAGSNIGSGSGRVAAIALGTLLGAGIGGEIGKSLDRADRAAMYRTNQRALENAQPGQSLPWRNPESGNSGSITPSNYYQTASGNYCREFTQTVIVGGQRQEGYGTACRQPDGTWQIVN